MDLAPEAWKPLVLLKRQLPSTAQAILELLVSGCGWYALRHCPRMVIRIEKESLGVYVVNKDKSSPTNSTSVTTA
jgi:hypothetical protein